MSALASLKQWAVLPARTSHRMMVVPRAKQGDKQPYSWPGQKVLSGVCKTSLEFSTQVRPTLSKPSKAAARKASSEVMEQAEE